MKHEAKVVDTYSVTLERRDKRFPEAPVFQVRRTVVDGKAAYELMLFGSSASGPDVPVVATVDQLREIIVALGRATVEEPKFRAPKGRAKK